MGRLTLVEESRLVQLGGLVAVLLTQGLLRLPTGLTSEESLISDTVRPSTFS